MSENLVNKFLVLLSYQGSSNPTFQEEEELSLVKEQICIYKDGKKKMINFQDQPPITKTPPIHFLSTTVLISREAIL